MGTISYNKSNLEECIRILLANAKTELESVHKFRESFNYAIEKDIPRTIRVFSRWDDNEDCFSATSLSFWRIEGSKIIVELAVYDKYSGYKATEGVGYCSTPDEVYEWLNDNESLPKCIETALELISMLD